MSNIEIIKNVKSEIDFKVTAKDLVDVMVSQEEERLKKEMAILNKKVEQMEINYRDFVDMAQSELDSFVFKKYKKLIDSFKDSIRGEGKLSLWNERKINCFNSDTALKADLVVAEYQFTVGKNDNLESSWNLNDNSNALKFTVLVSDLNEKTIENIKSLQKLKVKRNEIQTKLNMLKGELYNLPQTARKFKSNMVKNVLKTSEEGKVFLKQIEAAYGNMKALPEPK